jgi:hypothetical protein
MNRDNEFARRLGGRPWLGPTLALPSGKATASQEHNGTEDNIYNEL